MKSYGAVTAALLSGTVVAAQTSGIVDGKPIPDSVFKNASRTCGQLQAYVTDRAREKALNELNIVVTNACVRIAGSAQHHA